MKTAPAITGSRFTLGSSSDPRVLVAGESVDGPLEPSQCTRSPRWLLSLQTAKPARSLYHLIEISLECANDADFAARVQLGLSPIDVWVFPKPGSVHAKKKAKSMVVASWLVLI
jgi:hypothetical protein